jgi:hypothetical protein
MINSTIRLVEKYGMAVWQNVEMDEARKTQCLCMCCQKMGKCDIAAKGYTLCKETNIAFMVTRCPAFEIKPL